MVFFFFLFLQSAASVASVASVAAEVEPSKPARAVRAKGGKKTSGEIVAPCTPEKHVNVVPEVVEPVAEVDVPDGKNLHSDIELQRQIDRDRHTWVCV